MIREMPDLMIPAVFKGMKKGMVLAESTVRSPYLSGKALQRRTGRLRGSITHKVKIDGDRVVGSIGTKVVYGRIHELGFKGPVQVMAHVREVKQAFGKKTTPRLVYVRAHTRNVNMPARPFLRPAIDDKMDAIERIIANRIEEAFSGGN